jgi:hypothetical protein
MRNLVRYRRDSGQGWTCRWVAPVANDPERTSVLDKQAAEHGAWADPRSLRSMAGPSTCCFQGGGLRTASKNWRTKQPAGLPVEVKDNIDRDTEDQFFPVLLADPGRPKLAIERIRACLCVKGSGRRLCAPAVRRLP